MPPFSVSPSRVARFFYHECERYLRYHATPRKLRKEAGIPPIPWDRSPVAAAILEGGFVWEEKVIQTKLKGKVRISTGSGPLHERAYDIRVTLDILPRLKAGEAIYQPTIKIPDTFLKRYKLSSTLCEFPPCRPDLIHLTKQDGRLSLKVIDLKASSKLKASHRIQATLYTLMLREVLNAERIILPLDLDSAGIWLFDQKEPEWFDLRPSIAMVERFLQDHLPKILTSPIGELSWHLFFRCEWCEFYEFCRNTKLQSIDNL
jgi:DNA replication ATP-dependent helicase Dna2